LREALNNDIKRNNRGFIYSGRFLCVFSGLISILTGGNMFTYICFYKGKEITVNAATTYAAQQMAAAIFKAKKAYEITVMLAAPAHIADF